MSLWSHVSSLLWDEPVVHAREPTPTGSEAAGVPAYVRKAARFAAIGFSAVVLAAQVTGVRLAASVDADPSYCVLASQQCKSACTTPQCIQGCNDARKACERSNPQPGP